MVENYRVIDINDDDYRVLSLEKIINLYSFFFDSVWDTITNEYSKKVVEFLISYNDGIILPDRCGICEPLTHNFNKNDISMTEPTWRLVNIKKER